MCERLHGMTLDSSRPHPVFACTWAANQIERFRWHGAGFMIQGPENRPLEASSA